MANQKTEQLRAKLFNLIADYLEGVTKKVENKVVREIQNNLDRGFEPDGTTPLKQLHPKTVAKKKKKGRVNPEAILIDTGLLYRGFYLELERDKANMEVELKVRNEQYYAVWHDEGQMGQHVRPNLDFPEAGNTIFDSEMFKPSSIERLRQDVSAIINS